jgi:hypothetical protein
MNDLDIIRPVLQVLADRERSIRIVYQSHGFLNMDRTQRRASVTSWGWSDRSKCTRTGMSTGRQPSSAVEFGDDGKNCQNQCLYVSVRTRRHSVLEFLRERL